MSTHTIIGIEHMFAHAHEKVKPVSRDGIMATMSRMKPIAVLAALALAPIALSGCGWWGEDSDAPAEQQEIAGDADPEAVQVIADWSDALRGGDVDAAAEFFAIPSVAQNGIELRIDSRDAARAFNESLPCGARLIRAEGEGELTTATFRLTERPGPGSCGAGTGHTAMTAFRISDGEIVEWRRVGGTDDPSAPGQIT